MEWLKNKWVWWITGSVLIAIVLGYVLGNNTAKIVLGESKLTHEEITLEIEDLTDVQVQLEKEDKNLKDDLETIKEDIQEREQNLLDIENEYEEAIAIIQKRDSVQDEITTLEDTLIEKQTNLENLNGSISDAEKELEKLETGIAKKKEEPVSLIAGTFIVGEDVPSNRYQATNVGEGSNLIVYSSSGELKVNTILGDDWGSGDYIFHAEEGDTIETHGPIKLIPVE